MSESTEWSTWTGVLAVEDVTGAQGRSIAPGMLTWPMLPAPLFRMDGNESEYVGTITRIARIGDRLEASGRIAGYPEGAVLAVHMHIDAQGVRPRDRGQDPLRIDGGSIVGARLADLPTWPGAEIVVGALEGAAPTGRAGGDIHTPRSDVRTARSAIHTARLLLRPLGSPQDPTPGAGDSELRFALDLAATGQHIGEATLSIESDEHGTGRLSCVLHPGAGGQGLATEACAAILGLALDERGGIGLHRVIARMDGGNLGAARLAARLGMRQEAHHRRAELVDGQWSDILVYAMLAEDWPTAAPALPAAPESAPGTPSGPPRR